MDAGRLLVEMGLSLLKPLERLSEDPAAVAALLESVGWDLGAVEGLGPADLTLATKAVADVAKPLQSRLDAAPGSDLDIETLGQLLLGVGDAAVALQSFGSHWKASENLPTDLPARLIEDVFGHLLVLYLSDYHPVLRAGLDLLGVIVYDTSDAITSANGASLRSVAVRPRVDFSVLGRLWTDPSAVLKDRFGVGAHPLPAADVSDDVFPIVAELLRMLRLVAWYGDPGGSRSLTDNQRQALQRMLRVVWVQTDSSADSVESATLDLALALRDAPTRAILAYATGSLAFAYEATTWNARVALTGKPAGILIQGGGVTFADNTTSSLTLDGSATYPSGSIPFVTIGASDGIGLQVSSVDVAAFVKLIAAGPDAGIQATLHGVRLVSGPTAGDGFLAHVLPASGLGTSLDLSISWTRHSGLRLGGSTGLDVAIPLGTQLGPVELVDAHISVTGTSDGTSARATLTAALSLGPFLATVQGFGLGCELKPAKAGGSMGPIDVSIAVVPPTGVGLAIDATEVSGGGFLKFDESAGQYAGVFDLIIADVVSLKAIGIISTKLPNGEPGFALLIIITAEGFEPIPLGLGFTLTGIGGLLALNRTVDADRVRGGLRDGVLDSILFVKDPIHNATRLITTLNQIFPVAPDRLLIGPLAEISWGNPRIVRVRLALLLEIPQPIRVILLAALSVLLPDERSPIVEIHVDAIGVLDFARSELALDASLHDSRLLNYTLTGDMALRLNWSATPSFLLSMGGFHPKFTPPAGIRPLKRLSLSLTSGSNPRVRLDSYLAITSNTIQMGALASIYAEASGFGIDGDGSFDALISWSPFAVDVQFQAWVRVFAGSATLLAARVAVEVTGPRPWHITGVAEVQVLFFSVKVGIDLSIGAAAAPPPLETVDVSALLWDQVSQPANWHAALPTGITPGVTLAASPNGQGKAGSAVVVHPLASLTMRQKVVPLGTPISRVGARIPREGTRQYDVDVTPPSGVQVQPVQDLFAPGEYTEMSDDAKLTGPSFMSMPAGVQLQPDASTTVPPIGTVGTDLVFQTLDVTDLQTPAGTGAPVAAQSGSAFAASPNGRNSILAVRPRKQVVPA